MAYWIFKLLRIGLCLGCIASSMMPLDAAQQRAKEALKKAAEAKAAALAAKPVIVRPPGTPPPAPKTWSSTIIKKPTVQSNQPSAGALALAGETKAASWVQANFRARKAARQAADAVLANRSQIIVHPATRSAAQPHVASSHLDLTDAKTFRKEALKAHPDKGGSANEMKLLLEARNAQLAVKQSGARATQQPQGQLILKDQQHMLTSEATARQHAAATRIQSIARGRAARKEVSTKREAKLSAAAPQIQSAATADNLIVTKETAFANAKAERAAKNREAGLKRQLEAKNNATLREEILAARIAKKEAQRARKATATQKRTSQEAALKTAVVVPEDGPPLKTGMFRNKDGTINKTRAIGGAALGAGALVGLGVGLAAAFDGSDGESDDAKNAAAMSAPLETGDGSASEQSASTYEAADPTQTAGTAYGDDGDKSSTF